MRRYRTAYDGSRVVRKMGRLLLFNCSNDLALASGTREYIAPKSIAAMEEALSALPFWWAEDGDAVLVGSSDEARVCEEFFSSHNKNIFFTSNEEGYNALCKRTAHSFYPAPWGWSRATAERYRHFGVPQELLPGNDRLDNIRTLSSREFAAGYIAELLREAHSEGWGEALAGENMQFVRTLENYGIQERTIFKSPWSSSGRGIFAADSLDAPSIRQKLSGFIKRQGGFIADRFYDKRIDFALEYYITSDGKIDFLGYSFFTAGINGYYGYNTVAPQEELRTSIIADGCSKELLDRLIAIHKKQLQKSLKGRYTGPIGVDMLSTIENGIYKIHPCLEINLRMNIGILALDIQRRLPHTGQDTIHLLPAKGKKFSALLSNKKLLIGLKEQIETIILNAASL